MIEGLLGLAGTVAVILKLFGVHPVDGWSWWLVLSPWWLPFAWHSVMMIVAVIAGLLDGKRR